MKFEIFFKYLPANAIYLLPTNLVYVSGYFQQLKVDYTRHEPNYLLKNVEIDQLPNIIFLTSVGDNFLNFFKFQFQEISKYKYQYIVQNFKYPPSSMRYLSDRFSFLKCQFSQEWMRRRSWGHCCSPTYYYNSYLLVRGAWLLFGCCAVTAAAFSDWPPKLWQFSVQEVCFVPLRRGAM